MEEATAFAREWIAAWNAHDLERVLSHWSDDCAFSSPRIRAVMGDVRGRVRGKVALRAYWERALAVAGALHFELLEVLVGAESLVIRYRNHRGQSCAEWIQLDAQGRAIDGSAHYA